MLCLDDCRQLTERVFSARKHETREPSTADQTSLRDRLTALLEHPHPRLPIDIDLHRYPPSADPARRLRPADSEHNREGLGRSVARCVGDWILALRSCGLPDVCFLTRIAFSNISDVVQYYSKTRVMMALNLPLPHGRAVLHRDTAVVSASPPSSVRRMFNFSRPALSNDVVAVQISEPAVAKQTLDEQPIKLLLRYVMHTRNACLLCLFLTLVLMGTAIAIGVSFGNRTAASAAPVVFEAQHILQDVGTISHSMTSSSNGLPHSLNTVNNILEQVDSASHSLSPILNASAGVMSHANDATLQLDGLMHSSSSILEQVARIARHPTLRLSLSDN